MSKICVSCGSQLEDNEAFCSNCGAAQNGGNPSQQNNGQQFNNGQQYNNQAYNNNMPNYNPQAKSKIAAGLLGIFLGSWGIHNFYLGNTSRGAIQILVTLVTCGIGGLWGFIEGILILTGSINTDANGNPLRD